MKLRRSKKKKEVPCIAKYDYQGNAVAGQLSFSRGEYVTYDRSKSKKCKNGWVWGTVPRTSQSGLCPLSYLDPIQDSQAPAPVAAPPLAAPPLAQPYVVPSSIPVVDGFSGPIMGGVASAPPAVTIQESRESTASSCRPSVRDNLSTFGTNVQKFGRNSWEAVSTGAQKTGKFAKDAAVETKYRFQDMTGGGKEQEQPKQIFIANTSYPGQQRTAGEQKQVDVANSAARGAVVGGVYSGVFRGPRDIARGATRGAVWWGTREAVRDWKPFG